MKTAQLPPLLVLTYTYFTVKTAQLPPLWVLTYTYFYSENSSAATSGVNFHIFYSENRPAATSLGVNSLPPSVVCWLPWQTVWTQIRPNKTSGLIWINLFDTQMVFLKEFFKNKWFWRKSADDKKHEKLPPRRRGGGGGGGGKELTVYTRIAYLSYTHVWSHH